MLWTNLSWNLQFLGNVYENDEHVFILRLSITDTDVPHTSAWRAVYKIREGNENGNYKIETDAETNDGILSLVKVIGLMPNIYAKNQK